MIGTTLLDAWKKAPRADKEARRITVTRKPDGRRADTFILSKPESTMYLTASRTELYALLGEIRKALKE